MFYVNKNRYALARSKTLGWGWATTRYFFIFKEIGVTNLFIVVSHPLSDCVTNMTEVKRLNAQESSDTGKFYA